MSIPRRHCCNPVQTLFKDSSSVLASLCKRADYLNQLNRELGSKLPTPLNSHCKLANITDDSAIIHADSSAWSARLRYCIPEILNIIHNQLNITGIKSIRIKVMLPRKENYTKHKRTLSMSKHNARLLADTAKYMPDSALRSTLLRLSSHAD
jgi:hypothetical protein